MIEVIKGNSLYHLIAQADSISKLVLFSLFILSVITWAVFIGKLFALRAKRRHMNRVLHALTHASSLDHIKTVATQVAHTMPGYFLSKHIACVSNALRAKPYLSSYDWQQIERNIDQLVDDVLAHEESYLPVLSTSAAIAPLLGLLGTTWGLVHSFMRISEKQTADIATVAPGIAEALVTTFAGLVVAIPALIMYNYLVVQVRKSEQRIVYIADILRSATQPLCSQ